jgi:short-subunit dehydrogenase
VTALDGLSPLQGRALVTGGTSGIGLAFSRALAARGCDLVLVARDAERLASVADQLTRRYGVDVEVMSADLADQAQVEKVAERLRDDERPVEVLVNNAGYGLHDPIARGDHLDVHTRAVDVMIRAVLVLAGTAGHAMAERGHGVIVNIGSVAGMIAQNNYSAIKAWVNTFSDALGLELEGTGVQVLTLIPGWVRTEFHDRAEIRTSKIPGWLWLDADRLVRDALTAVEAGKDRSVPSARFAIIAFLIRHAPRPLVRWGTAMLRRGATS